MPDITELETERFTDEQRRKAQGVMKSFHSAETDKVPSTFLVEEKGDSIARLNAMLRYSPGIHCYAVLQRRVYIQITEIRPSPDGKFWTCMVYDEEHKGTALLLPKGGPLLLYIN